MISDIPPPPAWIAPAEVISFLLDPFGEEQCWMWTQDEVRAFRAMAGRLGLDPRNLLGPIANESGCNPAAHNPGGAVGLIQFEPATLRDEGWTQGTDAFAKLSVLEQIPYVERYFAARKAALDAAGGGMGAIYTAMFLPAFIAKAGDMTYQLCADVGTLSWAYAANRSFDTQRKGFVTVGDLVNAAEKALERPGPAAVLTAIQDAQDADEAAAAGALASLAAIPPDVT